ncbi:unnamed protein product [Symbiodinium necroappetens]|uniref:Uncharacterized protein n=1 Tax=Symbiodinium necroappetens TaxID=1628268 RepID=A0A813AWE5_9DINO|nr:unnamed protein product [Symbiodinium necroappetens]
MAQLPAVWEAVRAFRERSLRGMNLLRGVVLKGHGLSPVVVGNIECCRLNSDVLATILKIMADEGCIFIPKVFLLQGACLEFHRHAGYPDALSLGQAAYGDGWGLKRQLNFLKRKWMRKQTPRDRAVRKLVAEFDRAYGKLRQAVGDRIARALRARGDEDDDDDVDPEADVDSDQPRNADGPSSKNDEAPVASISEEMEPTLASTSAALPDEVTPAPVPEEGAAVNPDPEAHEEALAGNPDPKSHEEALMPREPTRNDLEQQLRILELKLEAKRL